MKTTTTKPIRILICDDHPIVRQGLRFLIDSEQGFELVGEAQDGAEGVEKALLLKPDITLMDLVMPKKDGIEAIGDIRRQDPSAKIMVLTSFSEVDHILPAIKAGAMGYILKDTLPQELLDAIRDVCADRIYLHPLIARQLSHAENHEPDQPLPEEVLSEREIDILKLIARGKSNNDIADLLSISRNTVGTHVTHILEKLNFENRTQAALYALRTGLVGLYEKK